MRFLREEVPVEEGWLGWLIHSPGGDVVADALQQGALLRASPASSIRLTCNLLGRCIVPGVHWHCQVL
jgi:hypothetical protein